MVVLVGVCSPVSTCMRYLYSAVGMYATVSSVVPSLVLAVAGDSLAYRYTCMVDATGTDASAGIYVYEILRSVLWAGILFYGPLRLSLGNTLI